MTAGFIIGGVKVQTEKIETVGSALLEAQDYKPTAVWM